MGLLNDGSTWLSGVFSDNEATSITYTRGVHSISLTATRGVTEIPMVDANGLATTFQAADYLIEAEDLDFGEGSVEPQPDDAITDGSRVYRVLRIPGANCFRYSDPDRVTLRIHTKLLRVN